MARLIRRFRWALFTERERKALDKCLATYSTLGTSYLYISPANTDIDTVRALLEGLRQDAS